MTTEIRAESNRRNALQSTGQKTNAGIEAYRFNALRHGLRSLEAVIPGEVPEDWDAHRAGIVEDLKPEGAVELALAEQIAAKLWRLGRVVRHEADVIAIGQAADVVKHDHEKAVKRPPTFMEDLGKVQIPGVEDVRSANSDLKKTREAIETRETAVRLLERLGEMGDDVLIPSEDWGLYEALKQDLRLSEKQSDGLFKNVNEDFAARHVRTMLGFRGNVDSVREQMLAFWRDQKLPELRAKVARQEKTCKTVRRRYEAALERLKRSRGLPDQADLDKIQRYEAHLERGLHKALERLRTLQEARGAIPSSTKPTVAVAVIQAGPNGHDPNPFGSFVPEAAGSLARDAGLMANAGGSIG